MRTHHYKALVNNSRITFQIMIVIQGVSCELLCKSVNTNTPLETLYKKIKNYFRKIQSKISVRI